MCVDVCAVCVVCTCVHTYNCAYQWSWAVFSQSAQSSKNCWTSNCFWWVLWLLSRIRTVSKATNGRIYYRYSQVYNQNFFSVTNLHGSMGAQVIILITQLYFHLRLSIYTHTNQRYLCNFFLFKKMILPLFSHFTRNMPWWNVSTIKKTNY